MGAWLHCCEIRRALTKGERKGSVKDGERGKAKETELGQEAGGQRGWMFLRENAWTRGTGKTVMLQMLGEA